MGLIITFVVFVILFGMLLISISNERRKNLDMSNLNVYDNHPKIQEIRSFVLTRDFLDDVNVQREAMGRKALSYVVADGLSQVRAEQPTADLLARDFDKIENVASPFEYLFNYFSVEG